MTGGKNQPAAFAPFCLVLYFFATRKEVRNLTEASMIGIRSFYKKLRSCRYPQQQPIVSRFCFVSGDSGNLATLLLHLQKIIINYVFTY